MKFWLQFSWVVMRRVCWRDTNMFVYLLKPLRVVFNWPANWQICSNKKEKQSTLSNNKQTNKWETHIAVFYPEDGTFKKFEMQKVCWLQKIKWRRRTSTHSVDKACCENTSDSSTDSYSVERIIDRKETTEVIITYLYYSTTFVYLSLFLLWFISFSNLHFILSVYYLLSFILVPPYLFIFLSLLFYIASCPALFYSFFCLPFIFMSSPFNFPLNSM